MNFSKKKLISAAGPVAAVILGRILINASSGQTAPFDFELALGIAAVIGIVVLILYAIFSSPNKAQSAQNNLPAQTNRTEPLPPSTKVPQNPKPSQVVKPAQPVPSAFPVQRDASSLPSNPSAPSVMLHTVAQAERYLADCLRKADPEIVFMYAESLSKEFESGVLLNRMLNSSFGVRSSSWKCSWGRPNSVFEGKMTISTKYLDGVEIIRAWKTGNLSTLSKVQRQTLLVAQKLVREETKGLTDPLQIERALHDALCRRVKYTRSPDEGNSVQDTAVGALLYGEAECDGYSDAFYLLGTLAGLNVGFQNGNATNPKSSGPHLWNVIELGGAWYHVDVTWDDMDDEQHPDVIGYAHFNVGDDLIRAHHSFDKSISAHTTAPHTNWNYFFYTRPNMSPNDTAYFSSLSDAAKYIKSRHAAGQNLIHIMVNGNYPNTTALHEAMKTALIYGQWTTWPTVAGPYTVFEVLFSK